MTAVNRRTGMPRGIMMAAIAAEHAEAIRAGFGGAPVDVLGVSTGGSIAQQLAADHPDVVARLVLCGTGARLHGQIRPTSGASQRGIPGRGHVTVMGDPRLAETIERFLA